MWCLSCQVGLPFVLNELRIFMRACAACQIFFFGIGVYLDLPKLFLIVSLKWWLYSQDDTLETG